MRTRDRKVVAPAEVSPTTGELVGRRDSCESTRQLAYLYRALDRLGNTIDFYLSPPRSAKAAKHFLGNTLNGLEDW